MRFVLTPALGFALLATLGCAALGYTAGKEKELVESQRKYSELVRWGEIEGASAYVDPTIADDFLSSVDHFSGIRFTNFESGPLNFGEDSETATVKVVYHAYSTTTLVEKRFIENQEWYRDADTKDAWRVRSDLDSIAKQLRSTR
jgi:hypothetical protein